MKFLVAAIWYDVYALKEMKEISSCLRILETLHTACIFHEIYFYTIKGFGDYNNIDRISW